MPAETHVVSFIVRFVYDQAADGDAGLGAGWHGVVRHVQSNEERHFTRWADAVAFIARYVPMEGDAASGPGQL
jgi:hypothetical protein